MSNGLA